MKIGLISDTHSFLDERVLLHFADCDEVWHGGDIGAMEVSERLSAFKPFRAVFGNIDDREVRSLYPEHLVFECGGIKVWMTHIGGYPPNYTPKIRKMLEQVQPDLFICGHSHILKVISDPARQLLHINPGAAGHHGFHHVRTLVKFDIVQQENERGRLANLQVIELGKRGALVN